MVQFSVLALLGSALASAVYAAPATAESAPAVFTPTADFEMFEITNATAAEAAEVPISKRSLSKRSYQSGVDGGYWWALWISTSGGVTYNNRGGGTYAVSWTDSAPNFTCGKGWRSGGVRTISYSASWSASGNSHLGVYGWTPSPCFEYYIMETWADATPGSSAQYLGQFGSDGGTYNVYTATRGTPDQSICPGASSFRQIYSVRTSKRTSGTITTGNHFYAWQQMGVDFTSLTFLNQEISVEGISGHGSATVTINSPAGTG